MEITASALWINQTFAAFDTGITTAVHKLYDLAGGFFTPFFELVSLFGKAGIFLILLSLALLIYKPTRRFGTAMLLGVTLGAIFTNLCLKVFIARPRPYADESSIFHQLWLTVGQNLESDKSFPSGHTTAAFATMTPVFILGKPRAKWVAVIFAVLMGIARIYLVVHYPSDVLAGMIVGIFAGCLGVLIAQKLPRKWYTWDVMEKKRAA
ncbi:MAG: phosphatase PAP2 family protein [Oscillospiraceae bacterium]|nr:phosphatase PAP2 family protein [Oscillospiraceae bacterium]